jgi:2-oxoglutarate dehydrogenase E2 component (dihydrolipoamide succinyltransferase)
MWNCVPRRRYDGQLMWAAVSRIAGDAVDTDEVIVQIETDKVTIDVRAPKAGVVQGIQVRESGSPTVALAV